MGFIVDGTDLREVIAKGRATKRPLVILGTAPGAAQELNEAVARQPETAIMAVNEAVVDCLYPITYAASQHHQDLIKRLERRHAATREHNIIVIAQDTYEGRFRHPPVGAYFLLNASPLCGTSALFAALAALWVGHRDITLAGVHLDTYPYDSDTIHSCWEALHAQAGQFFRSCGGWTKTLFGGQR